MEREREREREKERDTRGNISVYAVFGRYKMQAFSNSF